MLILKPITPFCLLHILDPEKADTNILCCYMWPWDPVLAKRGKESFLKVSGKEISPVDQKEVHRLLYTATYFEAMLLTFGVTI